MLTAPSSQTKTPSDHFWSGEVIVAPFARWEFETPIDVSERRLNSGLFHRFRICGVDIDAQTVELYFMDLFPDIVAAWRDIHIQHNERMGSNLAVQTRTFAELLANATWLSRYDVLNNKGLQGLIVRRSSLGYSAGNIPDALPPPAGESTAGTTSDWMPDRDDSQSFT